MPTTAELDAIGIDALRRGGSLKWTAFPGTIGAFVAEADFGTAPEVTRALHDAVDAQSFGYLPTAVSEAMSEATARWQRERYGWEVAPSGIHPIADVVTAFEVAIAHFSAPGSAVILPTPVYMPFLNVPARFGRAAVQVPALRVDGEYALDLEGIDRAFADGAGLLMLCNPWNPVGRVLRRDELTALSEIVERHGGRVFADEIHSPLVYPGAEHIPYASLSPATAAHTVTAVSASKAWNLPGLKTAQLIVTDPADADLWDRVGDAVSHGASTLGVIANTAAYLHGRAWLDDVVAYLDGSRRFLAEVLAAELPGVGYRMPEGTYLAWLDVRALDLGDDPARFFLENAGVALTEGTACGTAGAGFVRFVFATPRPIIARAVQQMAAALR
jgi:cysteine-S-conjugate beta-lyase